MQFNYVRMGFKSENRAFLHTSLSLVIRIDTVPVGPIMALLLVPVIANEVNYTTETSTYRTTLHDRHDRSSIANIHNESQSKFTEQNVIKLITTSNLVIQEHDCLPAEDRQFECV